MNIKKLIRIALAPAALAIATSAPALAQFPGDVFFDEPSVTALEGEQVTLRVMTFTGTQAFGAGLIDLAFNRSEFRIDEIKQIDSAQLTSHIVSSSLPLGAGLTIYNTLSKTRPFGTLSLLEITGTPLLQAGTTTQVTLAPRSLTDPNGAPFPSIAGFSAVISVVSAAAATPPAGRFAPPRIPYAPWLDNRFGAVPLRRLGHEVHRPYPLLDDRGAPTVLLIPERAIEPSIER